MKVLPVHCALDTTRRNTAVTINNALAVMRNSEVEGEARIQVIEAILCSYEGVEMELLNDAEDDGGPDACNTCGHEQEQGDSMEVEQ